MGGCCSKTEGRGKRGKIKNQTEENKPPEIDTEDDLFPDKHVDEEDAMEIEEMNNLRNWLHNDLSMFIINNVLMSVQFFKNFDQEILDLRAETRLGDGTELEGHQLKHFKADKLMDKVGTRVVFRPRHGPLKNTETLLHPLRSYLVYQNVQVERDDDLQLGGSSKQHPPPFYKIQTEELGDIHLNNSGYVNLKEIESKSEEVIYESLDGFITPNLPRSRRNSVTQPRHSNPMTPRRSSSTDSEVTRLASHLRNSLLIVQQPEEDLYGYKTIQNLTAPRSIHIARNGRIPSSSCSIPKDAFTEVKRPILFSSRRTGNKGDLMSTNSYLNSSKFLRNFLDVLAERLAEPLKLVRELSNAPVQGGRVVVTQGIATHHIIPVLVTKFWPSAAQDFMRPNTKEFGWPTENMQKRVRKLGMYLQPLGYLKRRGHNPDFALQWRYLCPRAEEYLLLHTMHSHMRCYLFTVTIFQSFLKSEDNFLGLDHTHILHLFFRQLKSDYVHWPEDKPGESLIRFLNVLYKAIETRKIRDFFLEDRNILESSPILFLNKAQGTLARLLENPLPFILMAIKNLRMRSSFYPELDVTYIYKLATTKNILEFLNPHLIQKKRPKNSDDEDSDDSEDEELTWKKKFIKLQKQEMETKIELDKGSQETINIDKSIIQDGANERRRALLEKFIPHFIEMGKKSVEYEAFEQAQLYFLHAKRLTNLLAEEEIDEGEVRSFQEQIQTEQNNCEAKTSVTNRTSAEVRKDEDVSTGIRLSVHSRELPQVPVIPT